MPIIALTPLLNNMFNITSRTPRVLVTVIIVFFPMFVNVTRGLVQVQPVQLELMRSMNANPRTVLRVLRVPNAIPFFFTGLKIAAPLAVIAALVAEYFGGPQEGLGSRITSAAANTAYGRAWAYVVASIILGLLFYLTVARPRDDGRPPGRATGPDPDHRPHVPTNHNEKPSIGGRMRAIARSPWVRVAALAAARCHGPVGLQQQRQHLVGELGGC